MSDYANALHILTVLSNQKQENDAAIDLISRTIQIFPHQPIYYNNLGNALRDSGRCRQAPDCYRKALLLRPELVEILINIGITFDVRLLDAHFKTGARQRRLAA